MVIFLLVVIVVILLKPKITLGPPEDKSVKLQMPPLGSCIGTISQKELMKGAHSDYADMMAEMYEEDGDDATLTSPRYLWYCECAGRTPKKPTSMEVSHSE